MKIDGEFIGKDGKDENIEVIDGIQQIDVSSEGTKKMGCGASRGQVSSHADALKIDQAAIFEPQIGSLPQIPILQEIDTTASPQDIESQIPIHQEIDTTASPQDIESCRPLNSNPANVSQRNLKGPESGNAEVSRAPPNDLPSKTKPEASKAGKDDAIRIEPNATLEDQIGQFFTHVSGSKDAVPAQKLLAKSRDMSNWFLQLGIRQSADDFLLDKSFETDISFEAFQRRLKEEVDVSRKLAWLAGSGVLRCVARALPRSANESDPLGALRGLTRENLHELMSGLGAVIADCLLESIEAMPRPGAAAGASAAGNNVKFCADPDLITMKCGPCVVMLVSILGIQYTGHKVSILGIQRRVFVSTIRPCSSSLSQVLRESRPLHHELRSAAVLRPLCGMTRMCGLGLMMHVSSLKRSRRRSPRVPPTVYPQK
jgi:hypothetical protein